MATTRMMFQRQQGCHVTSAALLVAMCIVALSAMLAPAPLAAAAAAGVSAGATTSASDAVGGAAATVAPATTTPPAAGDNVVLDTIRDLCRNRSRENRVKTCGSVMPAACAALDANTKASLSDVTNSVVDLREVAGHVLSGLDPASRARTTACFLALPDQTGKSECNKYGTKKVLQAKGWKEAVARTRRRIVRACLPYRNYVISACDNTNREEKCLVSFRQGKTTIEESHEYKEKVDVKALLHPGKTFTETVTRSKKLTVDCCNAGFGISDRCLCQMKKKLGNNTTIPCLKKKELEVCK